MKSYASLAAACSLSGLVLILFSCAYTPRDSDGIWRASWYGEPFHGRKTASGEVYNMYGLSAAHKHLPFGTRLLITNPNNGRSTVVTINDRGPFVRGRDIDLSLGAARKIGVERAGVSLIRVRILGTDSSYTGETTLESSGYAIQVASFENRQAAQTLRNQLATSYQDARIVTAQNKSRHYHRVLVGRYHSREKAEAEIDKLKDAGYSPLIREFF